MSDVTSVGDCSNIPQGEIPPIIPGDEDVPPGTWLPCGSCDSCGHPANECVTSPEGNCLWDPATCHPPEEPPGDEPTSECYRITVTVDLGQCANFTNASAMLDTVPNCGSGQYLPGTTINAHAVAVDPKCAVDYWSGCGASGGDNNVTFTATSSCTLTAHMHAGR